MEKLDVAREPSDYGTGVEVAEGHEPADAGQDTAEAAKLTLAQRLANIRRECSGIGKEPVNIEYADKKSGERKSYSIQAHTIEGVLHGIRGLFDRHGVWMAPYLVERSYNGNRCDVIVDFIFESMDDPTDTRTIRWAGADTDNGGKGFAKAGTNALKEMLKKTFLITDREDAKEETEVIEHQTDEGINRAKVEAAKEQARLTQQRWASALKASIESCPDAKTLQQIKRENSEGLTELPGVTRGFFEELFESRAKELKGAASAEE